MRRLVALPAQFFADQKAGNAAEPGPEMGRLAQFGKLLPRREKSFLGEVFAQSQAARRIVDNRADQRLIPLDDLPEGVAVARQAPFHQLRVVVRYRRHCLGRHHITV
jgi:hypothetical protein